MAIYRSEISQMMFVIGDSEPMTETTTLVEEIVRAQVIEMLVQATGQASRRNSKSISVEDLIFLIRHDKAKVNRLRTYLSWKDVRKNAKDTDGGADGTELLEDGGAQPESKLKYRKARVGLPWDLASMFAEQVPEREDEEDEDETEANFATMQRLKNADERTRGMSKDEYVHWSECRQASFTYRKSKRFREWTHMAQLTESRPSDDIVDILGFLTFEIVASITEESLKVKERDVDEEHAEAERGLRGKRRRSEDRTLFDMPDEGRTPLGVKHIEEGYRRLQVNSRESSALRMYQGGRFRIKTVLI
ncbi:Spt3 [Taphrina deformans PYCC 5710]|uniref:Spt3 n=1 Tax=Taphrina deformans (strain PYCC 5710 / ATCC 11124 / CBS 356.35 / IMI 108563 / JCM 9778 / NBRC 8474) TaxID=1097556 RepID=R4XEC4_TAPDE|nr:Spt3 [Taphrina deformans PYCC 5710]|eukprot:CCG81717.1 Spt3 [Taphrina deformans PYCC 5710]